MFKEVEAADHHRSCLLSLAYVQCLSTSSATLIQFKSIQCTLAPGLQTMCAAVGVLCRVVKPAKLTPKQQQLLQQFAAEES